MDMMKQPTYWVEVYNKLKDYPAPKDELVFDYKTGNSNWDDYFWRIINLVDYKSDNDYERISKLFRRLIAMGIMSEEIVDTLYSILTGKIQYIHNSVGNNISGVGNDEWSDVRADIISRGKDFYDKYKDNSELVQNFIDDEEAMESFTYSFQLYS